MGRRLAVMILAIALAAAGAADAAGALTAGPNRYVGAVAVAGAGSGQGPVAVAVSLTSSIVNVSPGDVPAPLLNVTTRVRGLRIPFARLFPVCTPATILAGRGNRGRWNGVCPDRSLVASGSVYAVLTSPATNLGGPGIPCHLRLWVYNGGPGRLTLFLTARPELCHGIATGDAAPWEATYREVGPYLVTDVPEPPDVSYDAGRVGLFGSLVREALRFRRMTAVRGHRRYPFMESAGCPRHGRAYAITYRSTRSASGAPISGSATVRGIASCG